MSVLALVDEHELTVRATEAETWPEVVRFATQMTKSRHRLLSPLLGTSPASGFEIVETVPNREVVLAGRHRYATYRLVLRVTTDSRQTRITAATFARFPGRTGRLYRALLLHTHGHQLATRRMLHQIRTRAERRPYRP